MTQEKPQKKSVFFKFLIFLLVLSGLGAGCFFFMKKREEKKIAKIVDTDIANYKKSNSEAKEYFDKQQLDKKIAKIVDTAIANYKKSNSEAKEYFDKQQPDVEIRIREKIQLARQAIPNVVEECTNDNILEFLEHATFDQNALEEKIRQSVEKNLGPFFEDAEKEADKALLHFQAKLSENREKFLEELAIGTQSGYGISSYKSHLESVYQDLKAIKTSELFSVDKKKIIFYAGSTLVFWKSELRGIYSLYTVFRKLMVTATKKKVVRSAVAATTAVVDGPLPIGDIFGGAFALWTVYDVTSDIKKARTDLQKNLRTKLDDVVNNYENTLLADFREKTINTYNSFVVLQLEDEKKVNEVISQSKQ